MAQSDPRQMLNLMTRDMLGPVSSGKCSINPLPNLSCPLLVVAKSKPESSVAKFNQVQVTDKLFEFPGVNTFNKSLSTHFLISPHNIVEIPYDMRRQTLCDNTGDLRPKHPPFPVLHTQIQS